MTGPQTVRVLERIVDILERIEHRLAGITWRFTQIAEEFMIDITQLTSAVQANSDAEDSVIVLIKGLADQISTLKAGDPAQQAQIDGLVSTLKAKADALAAAVVANTPAAPAPA